MATAAVGERVKGEGRTSGIEALGCVVYVAASVPQPGTGDKDFLEELNPDNLKVVTAYVEPSLASAKGDDKIQFERHGYFVADRVEHAEGKPVFNRVAGMKDSWGK